MNKAARNRSVNVGGSHAADRTLEEIRAGLGRSPRELPAKFFYDERGSRLFEQITQLPEYYLTRTERGLLRDVVREWISELRPRSLVELGAGSADKTQIVLDAMRDAGRAELYVPVDVSADFLEQTATRLRRVYPELRIEPLPADFTRSFRAPTPPPSPAVFAVLGSTIGNFSDADVSRILGRARERMSAEDRLLLGADLVKDRPTLEAAYNDAAGVTAEFNKNMLRVLNRRFGSDFDPAAFDHRAVYDDVEARIEMYLVSKRDQRVRMPGIGSIRIAKHEPIRTEISCKYDRSRLDAILAEAELAMERWSAADPGYAVLLARPVASRESLVASR